MTSQRQLERLMRLRRQRTHLAEEALAAEQRHCREYEAHCRQLEQVLSQHRFQAERREQALFEQSEQRPLGTGDLAAWQQALDDDADHHEALLKQHENGLHDLRTAERARAVRTAEWVKRLRAQRALEQLQNHQGQRRAIEAERLAELEMEENRTDRGGDT